MKKIEKFWFRYFSEETEVKDRWVRWLVYWIISFPIYLGVILNIINPLKGKAFIIGSSIALALFGIMWIIVFFYHNWRIKNERT